MMDDKKIVLKFKKGEKVKVFDRPNMKEAKKLTELMNEKGFELIDMEVR